jgi:GNAT superfamily N-acetyltransferase
VEEEHSVPRPPIHTRAATTADVPSLVALWKELRQVGGRAERAVNPMGVADVADRFRAAIESTDTRVVVACDGAAPGGMAVLRVVRPDPLSTHRVVQISHVVVAHGLRRRGVGHALVAAAAEYADELQVDHVTAGIYPSLREAGRFYARLGFAPLLVQRVAPVSVLRRRLGVETTGTTRVEDLVRRRNRLRRPLPSQRATAHRVAVARGGEPTD